MSWWTANATGGKTVIPATFAHCGLVLVSTTLVIFEVLFVTLLISPFWFSANLAVLGMPIILVLALLADQLLRGCECPLVAQLVRFAWQGRPPLIYRKVLSLDEDGFAFGVKRVRWEAIDELALSVFGSLLIKTRQLCGPAQMESGRDQNPADTILKLPFGAMSPSSQKLFIEKLTSNNSAVRIGNRLEKRLNQTNVKGSAYLQGATVVILLLALLDLGYSTCTYLETLKHYYLTKVFAKTSLTLANEHYCIAENLREHPLPISWITRKMSDPSSISDLRQNARTEALWALGRKEEALKIARQTAESSPRSFRGCLRAAALSMQMNDMPGAEDEIKKAIGRREEALLPRLYLIALSLRSKNPTEAQKAFTEYSKYLDENLFGNDPVWPPGGERFLTDVWYKEDIDFVIGPIFEKQL
jgi:tetratricopeptide (TPR) repeat protein